MAVAGEANVPFFSISVPTLSNVQMASRLRTRPVPPGQRKKPCVFIDEIDAIGRARGKTWFSSNDERENTLNQLLTEMDGFGTNAGVIVLAATGQAISSTKR